MYDLQRTLLPVRTVEWNAVADADNIYGTGYWPPEPVRDRTQLCMDRYDWEHDVLDTLGVEPATVTIPVFKVLLDRISDLITASPITHPDAKMELQLNKVAYKACRAIIRDSNAIFWTDPRTGQLQVLDARYWFPTSRGWVYAVPTYGKIDYGFTDLNDRDAHYIHTIVQDGETITEELRGYTVAHVGNAVEVDKALEDPIIIGTPGVPMQGPNTVITPLEWGRSVFDMIAPLAVEVSRRHTAMATSLGAVASPPFFPIGDARELTTLGTQDLEEGNTDFADQESTLNNFYRNVEKESGLKIVRTPPQIQGWEPATFDPQVMAGLEQLNELWTEISMAVGVPNLRNPAGIFGTGSSGMALRILNTPLYATTLRLQNAIKRGIEMSLELAGQPTELQWPHVFEALEGEDAATVEPAQEEVPE